MVTLDSLGIQYGTDKSSKCHNYLNFYEQNINWNGVATLLEIGIKDGASLRMWADWLPVAKIYGVDIQGLSSISGVTTIKADATKPIPSLENVKFDLIIDDGSHYCSQQQESFAWLWPKLRKGGFYIMEDLHTSFIPEFDDAMLTTFDFLMQNHSDSMKLFRRYRYGWTDSVTAIITKK
jgi:23S rRNA U2552 (ribose-2'-O)-methylase RlmE/FtsJ